MVTAVTTCPVISRVWEVSVAVPPGVEALPVSAPVNVSTALLVPEILESEQRKSGEVSEHVKVSAGVFSELPVGV
jgi:hypothetical protein